MKKETLIAVIAFLLGIVITQNFIMKPQAPVVTSTESPVAPPTVIPPTVSASTPSPAIKKPMQQLGLQKLNTVLIPYDSVAPKRKPSMVGLMVDENSVNILERTIAELSTKVKMYREDRGWRVQYLTPQNPMQSIGLKDKDLVLYEVINKAREDESSGPLVVRLEKVFSQLQ